MTGGAPVSACVAQLLCLGDDALVAAQRLSAWCSRAPEMEEDVALANIALDQLGAARLLLSYAGEVEGAGRDEDALAFLRTDREFRNCLLVELPDPDFAHTIAKLLFLAAYQRLNYERLAAGPDERLASIAAKAVKESAYHLDHATLWTLRLGDGTAESHARMQAAVDEVWPYTHELFEDGPALPDGGPELAGRELAGRELAGRELADPELAGSELAGPELVGPELVGPELAGSDGELRGAWLSTVDPVLAEATLARPADGWAPSGGRSGRHTEHLGYLLAEMQVLHRAHPEARW